MPSGRYDLPSISTLLAFEATARLSSVTRAAEELRTSHSAVSRHIRLLEKTFGVTLFERRGRGVVLTGGGQSYFLAVQSCMDTLQGAGRDLRELLPPASHGERRRWPRDRVERLRERAPQAGELRRGATQVAADETDDVRRADPGRQPETHRAKVPEDACGAGRGALHRVSGDGRSLARPIRSSRPGARPGLSRGRETGAGDAGPIRDAPGRAPRMPSTPDRCPGRCLRET